MPNAKVVIADDHPLFRTAMRQVLSGCTENNDILEAESFDGLLTLIKAHEQLELVFLDLHMPGNNGLAGLTLLQNHYPDLTVVMVSSEDNPDTMHSAIALGASAFIPKASDIDTIGQAVKSVLDGNIWLPDDLPPANSGDEQSYRELAGQLAQLTPQQYTVLEMIAAGRLNKQIAYDLNIQETTVKKHVSAILAKFGVNNRTQLGVAFQKLHNLNP